MVSADRLRKDISEIGWPVVVWLLLLLLRPVIDTTWDWKHSGPGVSPLQLLGAGLPAFFILVLWRKRAVLRGAWRAHWEMLAWGALLLLAALSAIAVEPGAESAGTALKWVLPPLAVLFGYVYLRSDRLIEAAAGALGLAGIVPLFFVLYELLVHPMGMSMRGGVPRFTGPYAQTAVYGLHFSLMLMGAGYLALKREGWTFFLVLLAAAGVMGITAAFVVHVSTWAVLAALTGLILLFFLRRKSSLRAALLAGTVIVTTAAGFLLRPEHTYRWVLLRDVEIAKGEFPAEQFANSRGLIWSNIVRDYARLPLHAQLFGSSLSGRNYFHATAFGAHNDFLRILMTTGIAGLALYLLWLARTIRSVLRQEELCMYFGAACLIILLGYSVALTPTYIMPLVTVLLAVLGGMIPRYARPADAGRATRDDGGNGTDACGGRATRDDGGNGTDACGGRATRDDGGNDLCV